MKRKSKSDSNKKSKREKYEKKNPYEAITSEILATIEKTERLPWMNNITRNSLIVSPFNLVTKKEYNGSNYYLLLHFMLGNNFNFPGFVTFNQAKQIDCGIKKGARGCSIMFYSFHSNSKEEESNDENSPQEDKPQYIERKKRHVVFNLADLTNSENIINEYQDKFNKYQWETNHLVDILINSVIKHFGITVEYNALKSEHITLEEDKPLKIVLNPMEKYQSPDHYYSTCFYYICKYLSYSHTLSWRNKLDKDARKFCAELASCFMCDLLGIKKVSEKFMSTSDAKNLLKENPKLFNTASGLAYKTSKDIITFYHEIFRNQVISTLVDVFGSNFPIDVTRYIAFLAYPYLVLPVARFFAVDDPNKLDQEKQWENDLKYFEKIRG